MALLFDLAGRARCTLAWLDSMLLARRSIRTAQCCGFVERTLKGRRQPLRVVGVDVEAFAHAGSGHVGESFIHEGGRLPALGVNDDSVSGCTLRRMTRHRVPMIEVCRLVSSDGSGPP